MVQYCFIDNDRNITYSRVPQKGFTDYEADQRGMRHVCSLQELEQRKKEDKIFTDKYASFEYGWNPTGNFPKSEARTILPYANRIKLRIDNLKKGKSQFTIPKNLEEIEYMENPKNKKLLDSSLWNVNTAKNKKIIEKAINIQLENTIFQKPVIQQPLIPQLDTIEKNIVATSSLIPLSIIGFLLLYSRGDKN